MSEIEAVGDAVTGGLLARAVEPPAGERDGHTHETSCLNCGCELVGEYCHCCGQHAHVHRTIAAWWHDFLHSVLHLDGKFLRTIPMLAFRPGELTRRYAHGERSKFISPLALFLFTVFLMFAVVMAIGGGAEVDRSKMQEGLRQEVQKQEAAVARLERERDAAVRKGQSTAAIDSALAEARNGVSLIRTMSERGIAEGTAVRASDDVPSWLQKPLKKAAANPQLLLYKLQANAYKFSWALIPISVPFVWLLFLHRRRYRKEFTLYDHLVFVTYSIAFMSMALVLFILIRSTGLSFSLVNLAILVVPPLHLYAQLRGAYGLARFSAAWRAAALLLFAMIALALFGMLLLFIGTAA